MTQIAQPPIQPEAIESDGVFSFGPLKQQLTIQDVASGLGVDERHVRNLLESGELLDASINSAPEKERLRTHVRIARSSVCAFYYERLAEKGHPIPFKQTPEIVWWRNELRRRRGLPALPPKKK